VINDAGSLKRRLIAMLAVDVACFLVAAVAMVGYFGGHVAILGPVFIAAIVIGVAAQVWFIIGFARDGGGDDHNASLKA
jgi:hypothetical protein